VAANYDSDCAELSTADAVALIVNCLSKLANKGRALEFGIGTGRIALPLSQNGIEVHGIDLSPDMIAELKAKPGGENVACAVGDFSATRLGEEFQVVYLVFNTIMNLTTQEDQVACFRNAAAHLVPRGRFVIECVLPELQRLPFGETLRPLYFREDGWGVDEYDVANQGLISHHINVRNGEVDRLSIPFRYAFPAEFDLMANLAGLGFEARYQDWNGGEFNSRSTKHVSIYRKG